MAEEFVSEAMQPMGGGFEGGRMPMGEPGVPEKFRWRKKEWTMAEVLERGRVYGDCRHGSGERYLRRHVFRIRTKGGPVLKIYFQRQPGRGGKARWWVAAMES